MQTFSPNFHTCLNRYSLAVNSLKTMKNKVDVDWYILACCLRINASIKAVRVLLSKHLIHDATGSLRAVFETLVMMIGADRIKNLLRRLGATFTKEQISLTEMAWETGAYRRFETLMQVKWRLVQTKRRLEDYRNSGFEPYGNNVLHLIAVEAKIEKMKYYYYKLLSLGSHPTLHAIEKYVRNADLDGQLTLNEYPDSGSDSLELFDEMITNFLNIATALLNDRFKMGIEIPTLSETLEAHLKT